MELKAGYKQTEVGVIPEDWDAHAVGDDIDLLTGYPFPSAGYSASGVRLLRGSNVKRGQTDWAEDITQYWPSVSSDTTRYELREGDLVIAMDGSLVGRSFAKLKLTDLPALLLQRVARIRSTKLDVSYLTAFVSSERWVKYSDSVKTVTAIPHISPTDIRKFTIPVPPTIEEQRRIAVALSDVEALIDALGQLIAKKRDLKQAAMQQLLSGQERLPDFNGEWDVLPLSIVIDGLEAGVSVTSVDEGLRTYSHDQCILKTSAVVSGRFLPSECKKIAPKEVARARVSPRRDTIIISRMNTPDLVGESGYVDKDHLNLFLPDRLWMTRFRSRPTVCVRWLSYLLSSSPYKRQIKSAATGTSGSMKNIPQGALLSLLVPFPTAKEQTAIAEVLSDMDGELSALEQRRGKTRAIKQGMMQELLTGRTRLV